MAYPSELQAFPTDPATLSPQTLRTWYVAMRAAFLSIVTEIGTDPGGDLTSLLNMPATTKTGAYTAALVDRNTMLEVNSASTANITIPLNATVAFPIGSTFLVGRYGAGAVSFVGAGGVTIRSAGALLALRVQYSVAVIRKRGTDEWWAWGDLA